jgi:hypothetical protein
MVLVSNLLYYLFWAESTLKKTLCPRPSRKKEKGKFAKLFNMTQPQLKVFSSSLFSLGFWNLSCDPKHPKKIGCPMRLFAQSMIYLDGHIVFILKSSELEDLIQRLLKYEIVTRWQKQSTVLISRHGQIVIGSEQKNSGKKCVLSAFHTENTLGPRDWV